MNRRRLLDLYCGAGGAAMGYARAGFEVVGVDIVPQKRYPFRQWTMDVLELEPWTLSAFDAIHASPPCSAYSVSRNNGHAAAKDAPRLIAATRALLEASGRPWSMENVVGARAELRAPVTLCGASLGLSVAGMDVPRHRLFEASFVLFVPPGVYGNGVNEWVRSRIGRSLSVDEQSRSLILHARDARLSDRRQVLGKPARLLPLASDPGSIPGRLLLPSVANRRDDHTGSYDTRQ